MKITSLGHSGYSVQLEAFHLLVDPVLAPTFQDGTVEVFPARSLDLQKLPRVDALFISHDHEGHLDIPTLAQLPRKIPVFFPADDSIEFVLGKMGFDNRVAVEAGQEIELGGASLLPTRGVVDGLLGLLVREGSNSFWFMDDQGSTRDTVRWVKRHVPKLGFLVCHYPALKFRHFGTFPPDDSTEEELARSLEAVAELAPALTCPNFLGIRYREDLEWMNDYVFPMSRPQFLALLARVAPEAHAVDLRPGDEVLLHGGRAEHRVQASPFVRAVGEGGHHTHEPMRAIPPLRDPNPEELTDDELFRRIDDYFRGPFLAWLRAEVGKEASRPATYGRLGLTCRFRVIFPGGERSWRLAVGPAEPSIVRESGENEADVPMIEYRICASVLDRWQRGLISYTTAASYSRTAGTAFGAARLPSGRVVVESLGRVDLLVEHLFLDRTRTHFPYLARKIAACSPSGAG